MRAFRPKVWKLMKTFEDDGSSILRTYCTINHFRFSLSTLFYPIFCRSYPARYPSLLMFAVPGSGFPFPQNVSRTNCDTEESFKDNGRTAQTTKLLLTIASIQRN